MAGHGNTAAVRARRLRQWAVLIVFTTATCGIAIYLTITRYLAVPVSFERSPVDAYLASDPPPDYRWFNLKLYDPVVGWRYQPGYADQQTNLAGHRWGFKIDASGSRRLPIRYKETWAATYGDSFTLCDEVSDGQTWQAELSARVRANVLNFGVQGYGTDQAVLAALRHFEEGNVQAVTILGIMSSDINRVGNVWRPYLTHAASDALFFKPILLYAEDGGTRWHLPGDPGPNDAEDVLQRADAAYALDYWSELTPWQQWCLRWRDGMAWQVTLLRSRMRDLIARFVAAAGQAGTHPVVLFIPNEVELRKVARGWPTQYASFLKELHREPWAADMTIVDVMDQTFDFEKFNILPFAGHASGYGNKVIAKALYAALGDRIPESIWDLDIYSAAPDSR